MTSAPRLLFHSASRRGLGHVMRGANLARAVLAADPSASVLVHVSNAAAGPACGEVPWVAGDHTAPPAWQRLVGGFRPTLVVFDTMLPGAWATDTAPRAFVWRASVDARHEATLTSPALQAMRALVVPHAPDEFGRALPASLAARATFTGPIVRTTDAAGQARVRARYGLADDDVVITSTVGGGGFDDSAAWLLDLVFAAHARWQATMPRLRHLVVRGPLASGTTATAPEGVTLIDADFDLVHLFAVSTLVVAEAGYNTINELRHVRVPALIAPGARTYDDQTARARALEALGVARVVERHDPAAALETLAALPFNGAALAAMRTAAEAAPFEPGDARAARALLDAAR
jgi:Glycosyltransferase family 28 C-terminal domain